MSKCGCNKTNKSNCTSCCEDTKPCQETNCGCEFEVPASCVRYKGEDLPCAGVQTGDTIEAALQSIDEKLCGFTSTYVEVVDEPAGENCENGGVLINVIDNESGDIVSATYVCSLSGAPQGIIMHREGIIFVEGSLTTDPFTLTTTDFANEGDGFEYSFFLRMDGDTVPGDNIIQLNGTPFVTIVSGTTPSTNEVNLYAYREGNDLRGHCTVKGFMGSHTAQEDYQYGLQYIDFFLNATNTINLVVPATTFFNNITIKKMLMVQ